MSTCPHRVARSRLGIVVPGKGTPQDCRPGPRPAQRRERRGPIRGRSVRSPRPCPRVPPLSGLLTGVCAPLGPPPSLSDSTVDSNSGLRTRSLSALALAELRCVCVPRGRGTWGDPPQEAWAAGRKTGASPEGSPQNVQEPLGRGGWAGWMTEAPRKESPWLEGDPLGSLSLRRGAAGVCQAGAGSGRGAWPSRLLRNARFAPCQRVGSSRWALETVVPPTSRGPPVDRGLAGSYCQSSLGG